MTEDQESQLPWEQPMDESIERSIRQSIGVVRIAIEGLLYIVEGTMEMVPTYFQLFKDVPAFEQLKDSSVDEEMENLKQRRDSLQLALQAVNELETPAALQIYKMISQSGQGKITIGMAKLMHFLKLIEPGRFQ